MSPHAQPELIAAVLARRDQHPDAPALVFEGRTLSWGEYATQSVQVANGLVDLGFGPGARVGMFLGNRPEFLFTYLGLNAARLAAVPVNTGQRGAALRHILAHSQARAVVVDAELVDALLGAWPDPPFDIFVVGGDEGAPAAGRRFEELISNRTTLPVLPTGPGQPVGILYTSGTTGPPRGVVADGYDLRPAQVLLSHMGAEPGETVYTCLPLFHGNALMLSAMGSIWNDWVLALGKRFSASRFWDEIRSVGAVSFTALGAMIPILLKAPPSPGDRDHNVRTVVSAACPAWAWRAFEDRFGVRLVEFYGMVDSPGLLVNDVGRVGAMGRAVTGVDFRVVDDDDRPVSDGTIGELVFRHPSGRLTHYHNNPAATAEAYRGGWFHSGDLARRDTDGFFSFAGRKKASIRRRGENISAWEIENVVNQIDGVLECAAHPVSSELGEDEVKVAVVLRPGAALHPSELIARCEGEMASYAVPRYVEYRSELPKTATHRVRYAALNDEGITQETWDRDEQGSQRA